MRKFKYFLIKQKESIAKGKPCVILSSCFKTLNSADYQPSLAWLTLIPGPIVDATTQLLMY